MSAPGVKPFLPVLVGGDIGTYAMARAFFERYGVTSVVLSEDLTGPIGNSAFIDVQVVSLGSTHAQVAEQLVHVAQGLREKIGTGVSLLLLTNSDWYVESIAAERAALEPWYKLTVPTLDTFTLVGDKVSFNQIAQRVGMRIPQTVVANFQDADAPGWQPPEISLRFPVVAKPALSSYYLTVHFPGKKKVYPIETPEELQQLWITLRDGGFRGTFLVQELIPGGDETVCSATAYVDRNGVVTLLAAARVLLEDHTPSGLGIPVSMATDFLPEILEPVQKFLESVPYHGFANFDIKIDPRDSTPYFFEVNPRIGRNNYYVTAAGANISRFVVEDCLQEQDVSTVTVHRQVLYTTVPHRLLRRYLSTADQAWVNSLIAAGQVANPLDSPDEPSWKRRLYVWIAREHHWRKFRKYYPTPTDTGF